MSKMRSGGHKVSGERFLKWKRSVYKFDFKGAWIFGYLKEENTVFQWILGFSWSGYLCSYIYSPFTSLHFSFVLYSFTKKRQNLQYTKFKIDLSDNIFRRNRWGYRYAYVKPWELFCENLIHWQQHLNLTMECPFFFVVVFLLHNRSVVYEAFTMSAKWSIMVFIISFNKKYTLYKPTINKHVCLSLSPTHFLLQLHDP